MGEGVIAHARQRRLGALACMAAALLPMARGQEPSRYRLSVDVQQVVLNVTVVTKDGAAVTGLEANDFLVYDEGELQKLSSFSSEQRPATVGLLLDNSRSMAPLRTQAARAAAAFLDVSHPDDDFFVVHFNEHVRFGVSGDGLSADRSAIRRALWQLEPDGQTALYDAVLAALDRSLEGRWEKRALLVISDGGDTASRATFAEALEKTRQIGAAVYGIGLYDPRDPESSPKALRRLAEAGGGVAYFPRKASEMTDICETIAAEIRTQYTLAFAPTNMRPEGRFHKIRVKLAGPGRGRLVVRTREGYHEPRQEE